MRRGLVRVGVALAMLVGLLVVPAARASSQAGCLRDLGVQDPGRSLPIILVHGFAGSPSAFDQASIVLEGSGLDVSLQPFDYSSQNTQWVDHPRIGPRLRQWIVCLSDVSQTNGGLGRVAVLAHSMGGLATRFALAGPSVPADMADRVALVATLGTPHRGSLLAGPNDDGSLGARVARTLVERFVDWVFPFVHLDSPAGRALATGSFQLASLPPWPDGVAVWAGAGQFVAEQRFLFFSREDYFGDIPVSVPSATAMAPVHDGLGGPEVVRCRLPVPLDLGGPGVQLAISYAVASNPGLLDCYHGRLTGSRSFLDPIVAQLAAASARSPRSSLDSVDFQNVTLPAGSCQFGGWENPEPIPLSGGQGESGGTDYGPSASVLSVEVVGFADFDGNGGEDALLQVECSGTPLDRCCAGATSILTFGVVLSGSEGDLQRLGPPITPPLSSSSTVTIESLALEGTTVAVTQRFGQPGESDCCRTGILTVERRWNGTGWS